MKRVWNRYSRDEIREIVLKTIKRYKYGVLITEIARDMNICRKVISEEVQKLEWTKQVYIKRICKAKLIFYKTREYKKC